MASLLVNRKRVEWFPNELSKKPKIPQTSVSNSLTVKIKKYTKFNQMKMLDDVFINVKRTRLKKSREKTLVSG